MSNTLEKLETVVVDEQFLAWYHKNDPVLSTLWEERCARGEIDPSLVNDAIEWMEQLRIQETGLSSFHVNSAEKRLWEQIDKLTAEEPIPATKISWYKRPLQIAAILLVLVSVILLANLFLQPSIKEYSTAFGEVRRFQLPDESFVTLNGNSSLKFQDASLFENSRKSWLEGEGYFEIQPTSDKQPFSVHLGEVDVLVTGTQFNAHKRPGKTSVFLEEGSVDLILTANGETVSLSPDELGSLEEGKIRKIYGKKSQLIGWKERKFIFENTSLEEVARSVEALYGIEVQLQGDSTSRMTITAILPSDNLDVFIESLVATQEFSVQRNGNLVIIGPAAR